MRSRLLEWAFSEDMTTWIICLPPPRPFERLVHEGHPGIAQSTGQSIWLHFLGRVRPGQTPSSLAATMISRLHEDHPGIAQSTGQSIWLHFLGRVGPGH